ncbi:MAG TPA: PhzF family phenazine biosynthesis protein [Thermoanaerobaculia bacterium]|nr:PhzF family phenazine biosynthesis protein [Thermoanaerobaculia bacterium]
MPLDLYQVDAFADRPFAGNPAAVCLLPQPRDDGWMQRVAREMNLSETAFLVPCEGEYGLRWFTPAVEVELCGHATLASAHVLWETGHLAPDTTARFHTKSGLLTAHRLPEGWIELDFPAKPVQEVTDWPAGLAEALGVEPRFVGRSQFDYLLEAASEEEVRAIRPDFGQLRTLPVRGVIVTARASDASEGGFDVVSRFFAPGAGVDEDPVTGSAHCTLGPYWAARLGKDELLAYQASNRGGAVRVRVVGERVRLGGQAVTVLRGQLLD